MYGVVGLEINLEKDVGDHVGKEFYGAHGEDIVGGLILDIINDGGPGAQYIRVRVVLL